jgi:hypothetical protein
MFKVGILKAKKQGLKLIIWEKAKFSSGVQQMFHNRKSNNIIK